MQELTVFAGAFPLTAQVCAAGEDLSVTVFGGTRPHVGCVCLAVPRPSLTGDGSISATVSTLNLTGHKDDEIASRFAAALAKSGNRVCVVTCGIHADGLTGAELETIRSGAQTLLEQLLKATRKGDADHGTVSLL